MAASSLSSTFHSTHSSTYDRMASKCTYSIAVQFLPLLPPITSSSYVLDNSCGTGLVTALVKAQFPSARIKGADLAPGMIDMYNTHIKANNGWEETVSSTVCDCRDLKGMEDGSFTHVVTNFGFAPDANDLAGPGKAAREMWRVLRAGGVAAVSIWKERNFMDAIQGTARRIRPDEEPFAWNIPDDWSRAPWLQRTLADAGFGERVEVKQIDGGMSAGSLDELVDNIMCGKDMFFGKYSEEEVSKIPAVLKEEIKKLSAYYEDGEGVGIKMESWVAFATK